MKGKVIVAKEIKILIVEDSAADAELIKRELGKGDFAHTTKWVKTRAEFLAALEEYVPEVILCDYKMPSFGAPEALKIVVRRSPEMPFIVISGIIGEDLAVEMMKFGAVDYVMKDKLVRLRPAVKRAFEEAQAYAERKRAENALCESEARFRIVADFTYDWEFWIGLDGRFEYVSPSVERITGRSVSPGAVAEAFMRLVVHAEDLERVLAHLHESLTSQGPGDLEFRIVRPDGEVRWMGHVCQPIRVPQGRFLGVRGSNRDITEHKQMEKELAQAKEMQFKALIESLPSKVFLKDKNSVYVSCNENYARDFKKKPEEISGKTDYDLFPTNLAEKYRADDRRVMETGETKNIEEEYLTVGDFLKGAEKVFINTVKIPVRDNAGNVTGLFCLFWDITERKRTEKLLRESENRYRNIFVSSRDAIMTIEPPSWKFTSGNQEAIKMFKVKDEAEFVICEPWKLSPELQPDGRLSSEKAKEMIEKAVREGSSFFEWAHQRTNDEVFPAEVLLSRIELDGKMFLQAVVRDITERKKREEVLRQSEEKYRLLAEFTHDWVYWLDNDYRCVYSSPSCKQLTGYSDEELTNDPSLFLRIIHPDERAMFGEHRKAYHLSHDNGEMEYRIIHKDGSERWIWHACKPIIAADGRNLGRRSSDRDITDRKKIAEALHLLNRQMEFVLGATHTGLDIIDSHFNLKYVDPEWKKVYGDFTGRKCYEYFMSRKEKCPDCGIERALETKKAVITEEILAREGNRCVQVTTIPFQAADGEWLVAEVNVDITERKKAETESRRVELLKTSSEIKSKFTAMVSHELRSPLSVIKEALGVVLEGLVGGVSDEQKKFLSMAKTNADRLGRLINNVLDFQKIESGKMEYDIRDEDIREAIQEASGSLRILAEQKGLNFRVEPGELLPKIKFDRDKIIQVVTNLGSNAIKFTPKGSVTISVQQENNEMHVEIRDTGPGIKVEDLPRLFQPFEQLDQGGARQKGGTGLGLAITREIVLAHGGRIWVEAEIGKGSTFHFTLPVLEHRRPT